MRFENRAHEKPPRIRIAEMGGFNDERFALGKKTGDGSYNPRHIRACNDENQLFVPELLRIRGELALHSTDGLAVCKGYFLRAIDMSDRRGSLSWTLRTATSLAIVETSDVGREEAKSILRAALAKFRDASDTFDLRLAARVLDGSYRRDHGIAVAHKLT